MLSSRRVGIRSFAAGRSRLHTQTSARSSWKLPPPSWSLKELADDRAPDTISAEALDRLLKLCRLRSKPDSNNEDLLKKDVGALIAWTAQIKHVDVPDRVKPLISPLDMWSKSINLEFVHQSKFEDLPSTKELLQNVPRTDCNLFVAPQALDAESET